MVWGQGCDSHQSVRQAGRSSATARPLHLVQGPLPRAGGVTGPGSPATTAGCGPAGRVHGRCPPQPPSAAPTPGTWCPPAIWSPPCPRGPCSALARSSTRPPPCVAGATGATLRSPGPGGRELLPGGADAEGVGYGLFGSATGTGRDVWCPAPLSMSGWRGRCAGEGVSPDVGSVQMCHHS